MLEKARLHCLDNSLDSIDLMFNPTQLTFARSVRWQAEQGNRGDSGLPKVNFSGVDPYKLNLGQLVFDTYETRESVIVKYINKLKKGVESQQHNDNNDKRPPVYALEWGSHSYFPCVIVSLSYRLDLFLPDGTPVRALADLSLQEVDRQNLPGGLRSQSTGSARENDSRLARMAGGSGAS